MLVNCHEAKKQISLGDFMRKIVDASLGIKM